MSLPLVSIIIPTKNEAANIARCLDSVRRQTYHRLETIVVDNYSTDQTGRIAHQMKARVYRKGPERSSQRNWGAKQAKGSVLAFIDADMTIGQNVIKQAVDIFRQYPKTAGLVVPELSEGQNYWAQARALERRCYLHEPSIEAPRIFLKTAFRRSGGYDPKLVAGEDWDLKVRAAKYGHIGRTDDFLVHHEGKLSLLAHLNKKYYYARHIPLYARKHPELFRRQGTGERLALLLRHWRQLWNDPMHAFGLILLKKLEYLTFLTAKIT